MSRRDYGQIGTIFWIRGSGKRLRGDAIAQVVSLYLSTSPNSNMIGLYYVAIASIAHETGHSVDDVREALSRIREAGFAEYDEDAELVWIPNHAAKEVGETMKVGDKRRGTVLRELANVGEHPFADQFREKYSRAFSLPDRDLDAPSESEINSRKGHPRSSGKTGHDKDKAGQRGIPKTDTDPEPDAALVEQLADTQAHVDATGELPRAPKRTKGAFGMELDSWCAGVSASTAKRCSKPSGEQAAKVLASLATHCPDDHDICEFAYAAGKAYGDTRPKTVSPTFFVDWMNSSSGYVAPSAAKGASAASDAQDDPTAGPPVPMPPDVAQAFAELTAKVAYEVEPADRIKVAS